MTCRLSRVRATDLHIYREVRARSYKGDLIEDRFDLYSA
jgi:hypothetical protein